MKSIIKAPPTRDNNEIAIITDCQGKSDAISFKRCGSAVPKTSAPTRKPSAFPSPFL